MPSRTLSESPIMKLYEPPPIIVSLPSPPIIITTGVDAITVSLPSPFAKSPAATESFVSRKPG